MRLTRRFFLRTGAFAAASPLLGQAPWSATLARAQHSEPHWRHGLSLFDELKIFARLPASTQFLRELREAMPQRAIIDGPGQEGTIVGRPAHDHWMNSLSSQTDTAHYPPVMIAFLWGSTSHVSALFFWAGPRDAAIVSRRAQRSKVAGLQTNSFVSSTKATESFGRSLENITIGGLSVMPLKKK